MTSASLSVFSLLATSAVANVLIDANSNIPHRSTGCDAVHMFLARGNNEPYPGRQAAMIESICDGVSNCGYEDLIYSSLYTDLSCQTVYDGVHAAYSQVSDFACKCPDSKLIMLGYSEGAQIMTDFLGGGGGVLFNGCVQPSTPALDRNTFPGNRIDAIVIFGDTRHTANQPYNKGPGSIYNGIFPRPESQLEALDDWTSILWSYCAGDDPVCAYGQPQADTNVADHLNYYNLYASEAGSWAKSIAHITDDSDFTTVLATSISGTVQNYATIPSGFIPPGTVNPYPISTDAACPAAMTTVAASIVALTSTLTSGFSTTGTIVTARTSLPPASVSVTPSYSNTTAPLASVTAGATRLGVEAAVGLAAVAILANVAL